VMFSFIVVAQSTKRDSNIYNTLFASGLFLLFIDPTMITSVGFQMSYLAVLGIVYLQPKIASWLQPESWLGYHAWRLTSTSLAAQAAVFPLGIYYFHQFPTYFVLANLVVIPGAFLILSLGFGLLLFGFFDVLASFIGKLLSFTIGSINQWVVWIEKLPGSPIQYISISTEQLFLLFTFLILLILFFQYRKFGYVLASLLAWLVFSGLLWSKNQSQEKQNRAVFYVINDHKAVDFYLGRQAHFMSDPDIGSSLIDYHLTPGRVQSGVATNIQPLEGQAKENLKLLVWQGKTFAWIDAPFDQSKLMPKISLDILIVENNSIKSLKELSDRIAFKTLIIGSTNRTRLAEKLRKEAEDLAINYHSLPLQGAFEINF
ncbi:MAG: ComEC/Rec2 family competence protein, partial [Cyclobacteriaceae bacterium]